VGQPGPWLAFAPIFQITHSQILKAVVPYLACHFRVITMDGRGNGRSDRPRGQAAYSFEADYRDFVAVLDAVGADREENVDLPRGNPSVPEDDSRFLKEVEALLVVSQE
jgi:pimeloyl-ACP methyl ester carboxylesterase